MAEQATGALALCLAAGCTPVCRLLPALLRRALTHRPRPGRNNSGRRSWRCLRRGGRRSAYGCGWPRR